MFSGSITSAPNINQLWARLIVEELVRLGITHFFVAPGSRSTPIIAAAALHPDAEVLMHFDERGTAFAALGYGRATGRPAVWITTSGTAVANGLPAIVEAYADSVPLLAITADRPPELRRTGANQTIDQSHIFGTYLRWHCDAPPPSAEIDPTYVLTTVDQAVHRAQSRPGGPVHLNWMFREPLAPTEGQAVEESTLARITGWLAGSRPYTRYASVCPTVNQACVDDLHRALSRVERGVVVAGRLNTFAEAKAAARIADSLQWPLLADIGSQLRLGAHAASKPVAGFDFMLNSDDPAEAVLYFGRRVTSKRLAGWIKEASPEFLVLIDDFPDRFDPDHMVTHRLEIDAVSFEKHWFVCDKVPRARTGWSSFWEMKHSAVQEGIDSFFENNGCLSEPCLARLLSRHISGDHALFVGNSMPVRDMDVFAVADAANVPVAVNRGASGIDGTLATAAGYSVGAGRPTTVVLGDLAFLHDLNSLAMLRALKHPLIVIVINNNGGGIFSFLPVSAFNEIFEPYFGTPHHLNFKAAATLFGIRYEAPADPDQFQRVYENALAKSTATLIEVKTDREENVTVHDDIRRHIDTYLKGAGL